MLDLIEQLDMVPKEYFKKLEGTDGLWEVRVQCGRTIFRLLSFLDKGQLVIIVHAFAKKTQRIPRKEILLAEERRRDYFQRKE